MPNQNNNSFIAFNPNSQTNQTINNIIRNSNLDNLSLDREVEPKDMKSYENILDLSALENDYKMYENIS